jgi:threonine aldolase
MIDLRSDTVTQPTRAMRLAIANAVVGDDLLDGDPTTRKLEERVADVLGKERGLFFPTGTMANQTALWMQAPRGTEVLADPDSHLVRREVAACAALCGVQPRVLLALRADHAGPDVEALVERELAMPSPSRISLVSLENTHNGSGGFALAPETMRGIRSAAQRHGVATHLDGARLWNAAIALNVAPRDFASLADTVMVCFDKGLGAPAGSVLAGTAALIDAARPARRRFGGAMRQNGILAAAALHALDHHMVDLPRDHERAQVLARGVHGFPAVRVISPQTNIVMLELDPPRAASDIVQAARAAGVLVYAWTPSRIRMVVHRDVSDADIETAISVLSSVLAGRP